MKKLGYVWPHTKKGIVLLLVALILLAACGDNTKKGQKIDKNDSADSVNPVVENNEPEPKDPIQLIFKDSIMGYANEYFMENYAAPIEKKFSHIKLTFVPSSQSTIPEMIVAKEPFDIVIASLNNFYAAIVDTDVKFDLMPLIKKYNYDLERLDPATVALAKQLADGGLYGLPIHASGAAITYNMELFDKFGVDYPSDGMDWDQFIALADRMTRVDGGVQYRGAHIFTNFMILRNSFSLGFIDPASEKVNVDTDQWKNYFEQFARLYRIPGNEVTGNKFSGMLAVEDFTKEQVVAMYSLLSGSSIESYAVDAGLQVDFVQFPTFREMSGVGPQAYPLYFYLSSTSQVKDDAFEVLAYLTSDEYQMESSKQGNFTVLQNPSIQNALAESLPKFNGKNVKAFMPDRFAPPAYQTKYDSIVRGFLDSEFKNVVNGQKDINTALRDANEAGNQRMEELKASN